MMLLHQIWQVLEAREFSGCICWLKEVKIEGRKIRTERRQENSAENITVLLEDLSVGNSSGSLEFKPIHFSFVAGSALVNSRDPSFMYQSIVFNKWWVCTG